MAKLKGVLQITGSLGDLSFYETRYGIIVRRKGGFASRDQKTDPACTRCVENGVEFGNCSNAGKIIRSALRPMIKGASDRELSRRLVKALHKVKEQDTVSARGSRSAAIGLLTPAGKSFLKDFNFNAEAPLDRLFQTGITIHAANHSADIVAFTPAVHLRWPAGATHCSLKGGWLHLDLSAGTSELVKTNTWTAPKRQATSKVLLQAPNPTMPFPVKFFVLKVEFLQEINGVHYEQMAAKFNGCGVLECV